VDAVHVTLPSLVQDIKSKVEKVEIYMRVKDEEVINGGKRTKKATTMDLLGVN